MTRRVQVVRAETRKKALSGAGTEIDGSGKKVTARSGRVECDGPFALGARKLADIHIGARREDESQQISILEDLKTWTEVFRGGLHSVAPGIGLR